MAEKQFVDFASIKERVDMAQAITFLNLKLTKQEGSQSRYECPACKGDPRALSINIGKGVFRCFEDKGKGGTDSIALVAHVKGIRQREAAILLDEHFPDRGAKTATSPAKEAVQEGRAVPDIAQLLGIGPAAVQALGAGYDEATKRFAIPLRSANGVQFGVLGIATDADQRPLLAFTFDEEETKKANTGPDELRKMFRVV